jgi:hypothetical protein
MQFCQQQVSTFLQSAIFLEQLLKIMDMAIDTLLHGLQEICDLDVPFIAKLRLGNANRKSF